MKTDRKCLYLRQINKSCVAEKVKKTVVIRTSFEEEQRMKDEAFLRLTPTERLKIHEQLRKRIWGAAYNSLSLKGLKVTKKAGFDG